MSITVKLVYTEHERLYALEQSTFEKMSKITRNELSL